MPAHKLVCDHTTDMLLLHAVQPSAPDVKASVPLTAIGARLDNRYTAPQVGQAQQYTQTAAYITAITHGCIPLATSSGVQCRLCHNGRAQLTGTLILLYKGMQQLDLLLLPQATTCLHPQKTTLTIPHPIIPWRCRCLHGSSTPQQHYKRCGWRGWATTTSLTHQTHCCRALPAS